MEIQEVEIGNFQFENEQLIQQNTKLQLEIDKLRTQMVHLLYMQYTIAD